MLFRSSQLSPDDNLPHQRISLACTTCIAQAFCSREIFYHIFVYLASVFCRKLRFFFFIFSVLSMAAFSVQDAQSQRFLPVENSPAPPCSISMGGKGRGYTLLYRITPARENGLPERPQTLRQSEIIKFSSAEDAQSSAARSSDHFFFSCSSSPSRGVM